MRLRTKLILACSLTSAAVSVGFGAAELVTASTTELQRIDLNLERLYSYANKTSDPLGSALVTLGTAGNDTEVAFYSINKDLSVLGEATGVLDSPPSASNLDEASRHSITVSPHVGYRFRLRAIKLPDEEYILFATSLESSDRLLANRLMYLTGFTALAVAIGALSLYFLTRRDLSRVERLTKQANEIAQGDYSLEITKPLGKSELDVLSGALASMVESLKDAVAQEKRNHVRMKDFIADASHELKTPLTIIRGYFELASQSQTLDQDSLRRSYARIRSQIDRMQSLIQDLLLLAEIEDGNLDEVVAVDVSAIFAEAVNDLRHLHPQRTISASISPNLHVLGSHRLLTVLAENATSNLSRHVADDCTIKFEVSLVGNFVNVRIEDSGTGLPADAYTSEITKFTRFDKSRSRDSGGSGLGLSIMNAVAEQHGGKVQLSRSTLGGLCLQFNLPVYSFNEQA